MKTKLKPLILNYRRFFCSKIDFTDYSDLFVDVSETTLRGSLIICPTPIGNINDLSMRQYEALTSGDVIATENVLKTARLYDLIAKKKMKERFNAEFGVSFEEFLNKGGLNMSEDKLVDEFVNINPSEGINYHQFYETERDREKDAEFRQRVVQAAEGEDINVNDNFFKFVKDSEDYRRKEKILNESREQMKYYIDPLAENYDEKAKIAAKLRKKALFILNLERRKGFDAEYENPESKEEEIDMEYEFYSMSESQLANLKRKIREIKQTKGRGILVSFNKDNESKRVEKLITAMRLGLKVVLVSLAGTPLISDPGSELVRKTIKSGLTIEPLPGACALTTALSASGMDNREFIFTGFLPKTKELKEQKIVELKKLGKTSIIYESPHRILKTLELLAFVFGEEHRIYVGSELSKFHETNHYGTIADVLNKFGKMEIVKGEHTIVVAPKEQEITEGNKVEIDIEEFCRSLKNLPDAVFREVLASGLKISRQRAHDLFVKHKNKTKFDETDKALFEYLGESKI